jgi:hypothetical protein
MILLSEIGHAFHLLIALLMGLNLLDLSKLNMIMTDLQ